MKFDAEAFEYSRKAWRDKCDPAALAQHEQIVREFLADPDNEELKLLYIISLAAQVANLDLVW